MSLFRLVPYLIENSNVWRRPNRDWISPLEDTFFRPFAIPKVFRQKDNYFRDLDAQVQDTVGSVTYDKDKFHVHFDVEHFKPEEISIKLSNDRVVTVEGKHEEKRDDHGQIYRHFVRKYTLPENCDIGKVESKLSADGVLTISAPRTGEDVSSGRSIPITRTGEAVKSIQNETKKDD